MAFSHKPCPVLACAQAPGQVSDSLVRGMSPHLLSVLSAVSRVLSVILVQGSLAVATQMLMSEEAYAVPGLRAGLGRLANSVVAVLGPELSPGTDVYSKCKALIREIQVGLNLGCC